MRNLLPRFYASAVFLVNIAPKKMGPLHPRGFTLVELLVVIVILAILGVIGITIFTGTQSKARDARRKADIQAMSKAMEANYVPGAGYPLALVGTWFADGSAPTNPAPPAGGVYTTTFTSSSVFTFCAPLENATGNATSNLGAGMTGISNGTFFCKKNSQ